MTKPKTRAPVSSFGPELQSVLKEGANKRIEVVLATPALAIRLVSRINALRAAMRKEGHPDSDRLYRAGVSISRENSRCVIIAPKDSEFRDALKQIGIPTEPTLPPPQEITFEAETPKPGVEEDPASSFLSTLGEATKSDGTFGGAGASGSWEDEKVRGEEPPSEIGVDNGDK